MQLAPSRRLLRQLCQPGQGLLFGAHVAKAITPPFRVQPCLHWRSRRMTAGSSSPDFITAEFRRPQRNPFWYSLGFSHLSRCEIPGLDFSARHFISPLTNQRLTLTSTRRHFLHTALGAATLPHLAREMTSYSASPAQAFLHSKS
jgi:hypothetical protein